MAARAAEQLGQLAERGVPGLAVTALPQADELLLQTTRGHKRGTPDKKSAIY
jgi:hypothetical protein